MSEAGAGGGASTYRLREQGVDAISSNVMTGQRGACWAVVTPNGRFGYVTNAGTGNISGFAIAPDGTAELLDASGIILWIAETIVLTMFGASWAPAISFAMLLGVLAVRPQGLLGR